MKLAFSSNAYMHFSIERTIAKSRKNLKNARIPLAARTQGREAMLTE